MTVHFLTRGDIHSLTGGYLFNMCMIKGLDQKGYSVKIIGTDWQWDNKPVLEKISRLHFEKMEVGSFIVLDSLVLPFLQRQVQEFSERLVFAGLIHLPASFDILTGVHGKLSREEIMTLHQLRQVIVTGRFTFDLLVNAGLDPEKIRIVEPGTGHFPQKKKYKPVPSELLCISNYSSLKAQDVLIRALHRLTSREWTLHLYGNPDYDREYAASVRSLIRQSDMHQRIIMHGIVGRDEISAVLLDADLFVMPSLFESYGMALTESLVHGIPVVTTTAGNIPHTVPAGMGLLVEPGNEEQLAEAILSLMDDPAKYNSLCTAASQYHFKARSWEQAVREFEKIVVDMNQT